MLANFLTRPLQGRLLHTFRAVNIGHRHLSCFSEFLPLSNKRVVKKVKRGSLEQQSGTKGGTRLNRERARWEASRESSPSYPSTSLTNGYKALMGNAHSNEERK